MARAARCKSYSRVRAPYSGSLAPEMHEQAAMPPPFQFSPSPSGSMLLAPWKMPGLPNRRRHLVEDQHIRHPIAVRAIWARAVQGSPVVDDAASGREWARDGITRVEPADAFQRMDPRIVARKPVWQHGSFVCPGKIGHATVGLIHRLQRQPEADFLIVERGILKRLILMPGCRVADQRRLHQRDIGLEPDPGAQDLLRDTARQFVEAAADQFRGERSWVHDLGKPGWFGSVIDAKRVIQCAFLEPDILIVQSGQRLRNALIASPERPVSNARNPSSRKRRILSASSRIIWGISLSSSVHHTVDEQDQLTKRTYVVLPDRV